MLVKWLNVKPLLNLSTHVPVVGIRGGAMLDISVTFLNCQCNKNTHLKQQFARFVGVRR